MVQFAAEWGDHIASHDRSPKNWNGGRTYSSWHGELTQAPELRQQVAKRLRLPRSADRSAQNQSSGLNLGRAITPHLGDNNAGCGCMARGNLPCSRASAAPALQGNSPGTLFLL